MKKSWIPVAEESNFPIQNIPFGIFSTPNKTARPGVAIGDQILDLLVLWENGFLHDFPFQKRDIDHCVLNDMMRYGKSVMSKLRLHIIELLSEENVTLAQHPCVNDALVNQVDATMHLPVHVGDYTDFYILSFSCFIFKCHSISFINSCYYSTIIPYNGNIVKINHRVLQSLCNPY